MQPTATSASRVLALVAATLLTGAPYDVALAGGNDSGFTATTKTFHYNFSPGGEAADVFINVNPTRTGSSTDPPEPMAKCKVLMAAQAYVGLECGEDSGRPELRNVRYKFIIDKRPNRVGRFVCIGGCQPTTPRAFKYYENPGEDG